MSIIVYPKSHFNNSDKQFKWSKQLLRKFPKEIIRILPSESATSDALHGLQYGVKMTVRKAVGTNEYYRRFGCGCGLEYDGDNEKFIAFLTKTKVPTTRGLSDTTKEINVDKRITGSQESTITSELAEEEIDKDFLQIDTTNKKAPAITLASGLIFTVGASFVVNGVLKDDKKEETKKAANKALKAQEPATSKEVEQLTELYNVQEDGNILLRKATITTIKGATNTREYLLYSKPRDSVMALTKVTTKSKKDIDFTIKESVLLSELNKSNDLLILFNRHYKDFNPKEVTRQWQKIS